MLGGGTFVTQNKVLPGSYINFISAKNANATLSERGVAIIPMELDWGIDGEIFEVTNDGDFSTNTRKIFGYEYTHDKLKGIRDLFLNVKTLYAYRLNTGDKATSAYGTARYSGIRGNDLKIAIKTNIDDLSLYDIQTILGNEIIETQSVTSAATLVDNDFIIFNKTATLELTAGVSLTGGTNATVTASQHQEFLDKAESYAFNIMGLISTDNTLKQLYANYTKRMREEIGAKFQLVLHSYAADYEGIINVKNAVTDEGANPADILYWIIGAQASTEINKSMLNKLYNGEYTVNTEYTQTQLINAIKDGEFTLHNVGKEVRVLEDINSLTTVTDTKGEVFKDNQTIRVIDQIANDIAVLFNTKYLGNVPNDDSGRTSLWADIVQHHNALQNIRAIENFVDSDISVSQGISKKSVVVNDVITIISTMTKLYMTVQVN